MKITRRQCILGLFLFMILVDMHFLYLFKYPDLFKNILHRRLIPGTVGLLVFVFAICKYRNIIRKYFGFLKKTSYLVLLTFIILYSYTITHYPAQPWNVTYLSTNNILIILWALPLAIAFRNIDDMKKYIRIINYVLLIWFIIVAVQSIIYKFCGSLLLGFEDLFSEYVRTRNNGIRFELGGIANVMILYNFDIVFTKKEKKIVLPLLVSFLGIFDVIFVQQTRIEIAALFLGLLIILLLGGKNKKQKIISSIIIIGSCIILLSTNYISQFINSFSITGSESGSTIIRLQ